MDRLSDYDYELPSRLIAQEPLADRSASRLLLLHFPSGRIEHRTFRDVPAILHPTDLIVLNDTRVSARRLVGRRPSG
ncbi:MAG: tRNA preQ1(34) S-adenosylmethionine ribosyltransferase-isomerase QueA, partial [Armatimonadota bacterium]